MSENSAYPVRSSLRGSRMFDEYSAIQATKKEYAKKPEQKQKSREQKAQEVIQRELAEEGIIE